MPIREMPAFVFSHKEVRNAVFCALASSIFLIIQLILMKRNVLSVAFDVVIPITATFTFGCYAITMAMDRPLLLICPPIVFFVSPLIKQLISVEVAMPETYPIFTLLEMIPFLMYCVSVCTLKFKKATTIVLNIGCLLIVLTILVLIVLAVIFHITLFSKVNQITAQFCGMLSVGCVYVGMIEQIKIAGTALKQK